MPTKPPAIELPDDCIVDRLDDVFDPNPANGRAIKLCPRTIERRFPELIIKIGQKKFIRRDKWKAMLRDGQDEADAA